MKKKYRVFFTLTLKIHNIKYKIDHKRIVEGVEIVESSNPFNASRAINKYVNILDHIYEDESLNEFPRWDIHNVIELIILNEEQIDRLCGEVDFYESITSATLDTENKIFEMSYSVKGMERTHITEKIDQERIDYIMEG